MPDACVVIPAKAGIQKLGESGMFTLRMRGWHDKRIPPLLAAGRFMSLAKIYSSAIIFSGKGDTSNI
jgi:hypothetical protein